jgi:5'-deoxy-5'-methylthioadenosine phosphorylase
MAILGIVGGTGLERIDGVQDRREQSLVTPYGPPSAPLVHARIEGRPVIFLARHGIEHRMAPHEINYRANLWALAEAGATSIVGVGAVGAIRHAPEPASVAVPDQLIDYTHGRAQTFFEGAHEPVHHVDFSRPYTPRLRTALLAAAEHAGVEVTDGGCYGATQGPRLETVAEIERMERDGCTLVGMTGMPEAVLARELGLPYAALCVVANMAAGKADGALDIAVVRRCLETGMTRAQAILAAIDPV